MNVTESPSLSTPTSLKNVTEPSDVATTGHGKTAALIIIMAASLVLNVLVIVVIFRRKTVLRTNHSTLILHMTLSELGLTVACMPLTILSVFDNGATLKGSMPLCMVNGFTSVTFPICSTMLLSIVSIDRYFAICKAVHYPTKLSPFRLKLVVTCVWMFSCLGAILILTHFACWLPYTIMFGGVVQGLPSWVLTLVMWGKAEGARPRGRPRRSWISDLKEWTSHSVNQMTKLAEDHQQWRAFTETYAAPTAD
ncbi:HCRTR2 [Branchiostoma lanceolatum]|uniref:HCRTR2 protein n=1 Tax=Branchiostoma lanceolatum TaxID=7740 RepID=A0A8J9Z970_BRALA|nr:HCRTR2 [Branchiostoma lanceolatum]